MKVTVKKDACIGCGVCSDIAEMVFELKKGISVPRDGADLNSKTTREAVMMAKECCPVQAINITENNG